MWPIIKPRFFTIRQSFFYKTRKIYFESARHITINISSIVLLNQLKTDYFGLQREAKIENWMKFTEKKSANSTLS